MNGVCTCWAPVSLNSVSGMDREESQDHDIDYVDIDPLVRKNLTWRLKMSYLREFHSWIFTQCKEQLLQTFLLENPDFFVSYFPEFYKKKGSISLGQFHARLEQALAEEDDQHFLFTTALATYFITNHMETYQFFEQTTARLSSTVEENETFPADLSSSFIAEVLARAVTPITVFVLVVLLSMMIDQEVFLQLKVHAQQHLHTTFSLDGNELVEINGQNVVLEGRDPASTPSSPLRTSGGNELKKSSDKISIDDDAVTDLRKYCTTSPILRDSRLTKQSMHTLGRRQSNRGSMSEDDSPSQLPGTLKKLLAKKRIGGWTKRSSFIIPRRDEDYGRLIKAQNMSGYLLKQSHDPSKRCDPCSHEKVWKRRWCIFSNGCLQYYRTEDRTELLGQIPLFMVNSARKAPKLGKSAFVVHTGSREFFFKAESESLVQNWLFGFQCAVAVNLREILEQAQKRKQMSFVTKWWKRQDIQNLNEEELKAMCGQHSAKLESYLHNPKNHNTEPSIPPFNAVVYGVQGHRETMEDRHIVVTSINELIDDKHKLELDAAFFGIFDGHGGSEAAQYAKDYLLSHFLKYLTACKPRSNTPREPNGIPGASPELNEAIFAAFTKTDAGFIEIATRDKIYSGTTANVVILRKNCLIVANLGDTRAVLCRNNEACALSSDHRPSRRDEYNRILRANGVITTNKELNMKNLYNLNPELLGKNLPARVVNLVGTIDCYRILGELSVSRAIGDPEYKGDLKNKFWENYGNFTEDLVLSVPEITETRLDSAVQFLIIACDGLWDVFDNQDAVTFVVNACKVAESTEAKIAQLLVQEALNRGSQDNVSVIIIFFKTPSQIGSTTT